MQRKQKLVVVLRQLPGNDVRTPNNTGNTPPGSTTERQPNELKEVVVTGKRMQVGESRKATTDDGTEVTITKVANGQYTVTDASGQVIKRGGTEVLEGYGFANLT